VLLIFIWRGLNVVLVCCDCCSSDEVSAVRRLLDKIDLQGYQVMDVNLKKSKFICKLYKKNLAGEGMTFLPVLY
jgi:hypothetical protein